MLCDVKRLYLTPEEKDYLEREHAVKENGKNCIPDITLNVKVTFSGINKPDSATLNIIRDKSHDYCFISNSVNSSLTINIEVR